MNIKMFIFGVTVVLYFIKILSGSRNTLAVSLLKALHKHYFKLSQDHNCTLSAVCSLLFKTRAGECIIRYNTRERSSSVLNLIKHGLRMF